MARILITGAAGFVGRHLMQRLSSTHEVFGVVRTPKESQPGVHWIERDLSRPDEPRALPASIDAVVHLAQARGYRDFPDRATEIFAVNVGSTARLLEYARRAGATTFVLASTGGLYGSGTAPFRETDDVNPQRFIDADKSGTLNFYFASKYAAELLVANYRRFFRTVVLRPFFAYGPGQTEMLLPTLVAKILRNEAVTISGNPGIKINPVHVRDVASVIERSLDVPVVGPLNIAGREVVSLTELAELIAAVAGRRASITHTEASLAGDLVADISRMRNELGLQPHVMLREGLAEMINPESTSR